MPSLFDRMIADLIPAVPRPIVRRISRRYIAGETSADVLRIAKEFKARGLRTTMDILGEDCRRRDQARESTRQYLELIRLQAAEGVDRNVSLKLTQLGLKLDPGFCLENMASIMGLAAETGGKVRIDMEDSRCTDGAIRVFRELRPRFENVGLVLQACLYRTEEDVRRLAPLTPDYRLCKGSYVEAPAVAIQSPAGINENYLKVLARMWEQGSYVGVATHDEALIRRVLALIERQRIGKDRYEFQMLLGVTESLRDRLLAQGHPLRVYLPFGREWYAYCVRRLKENPAIAGHVMRALFRRS